MEKNPKTAPFGHIFKKKHIHSLVHGHFSCFTFWFAPSEGPKALKIHLLEIGPWNCDHGKRPFDMGQLCGP